MAGKKEFSLDGVKKYPLLPSVRILMTFLLFLGCNVLSGSFFTMAFSINCMVNSTAIQVDPETLPIDNRTLKCMKDHDDTQGGYSGSFLWSTTEQAQVLAGVGYGGVAFIFIGGILVDRIGARVIYPTGLAFFAITNALIPTAARRGGWIPVLILRAVQGFCQIIGWPCILVVTTQWFPIQERGLLLGLAASGSQVGALVVNAIGGVFCDSSQLGWESLYYVVAAFCLLSMIFWLVFYHDDLESSYFLSPRELTYILRTRGPGRKKKGGQRTPWIRLLTSPCIIAIMVINLSAWYMYYFISDYMAKFYKDVLFLSVQSSGLYSAIPNLFQVVGRLTGGPISDLIQRYTSATFAVKVVTAVGVFLPAVCILGVAFADCNSSSGAIAGFMLAYFFFGLTIGGFFKAASLVAPPFAGTIGGITQTFNCLASIIAPIITGKILGDNAGDKEWKIAFFVAVAVGIAGGVFFSIWGSGEAQPWSRLDMAKIRPSVIFTGFDLGVVGFEKNLTVVGDDRRFSEIAI